MIEEDKTTVRKEREKTKAKLDLIAKERKSKMRSDIKAYRVILKWEDTKGKEKYKIRTCSVCGLAGDQKGTVKRCPFMRGYNGRLPKAKHRRSKEMREFIRDKIRPYIHMIDHPEADTADEARICEWCGKTYNSEKTRWEHDKICVKGRIPIRFKCTKEGCVFRFNGAKQRDKHSTVGDAQRENAKQ